jgi:3-deoxy-manno-octulosonate cytidylyltransferase (CMP-KDO synthetase)
MKKIAMIPARYAATRFPFKLMQPLGDKTVIRHTYDNAVATGLFDDVMVVTDHELIFDEIIANGGKAVMSKQNHESGSDRIAEAVRDMDIDIILNVQGDEPFLQKEPLQQLLEIFDGEDGASVQVASLMKRFTDPSLVHNPNFVKVVVDRSMNALLFSRSVIPYHRDEKLTPNYYEHIGVYAFRKEALLNFNSWTATPMEQIEKLEQLRYLENGVAIKMVETESSSVKIDVPEDLVNAEKYLRGL